MTAPGIYTDRINRLYDVTFVNGAEKLSGAGGGGSVVFLVHTEDRPALLCALDRVGRNDGLVKFPGGDANRES
jgi:mevalonate kinase